MNEYNIDTKNAPKRIWQTIMYNLRAFLSFIGVMMVIGSIAGPLGIIGFTVGLVLFLQAIWMGLFTFYDAEVDNTGKVGQITSLGMKGIIFRTMEGELRPLRVSDEKWKFSVANKEVMDTLVDLHEKGVDVRVKYKHCVQVPASMGKTNILVYSAEAIGGEDEK